MSLGSSFKTGMSFGITSGIITTLGLVIGLNSSTHSKIVVIGGILTIAIADSLSDALGIEMSEEADKKHKIKDVWISALATLLSKLVLTLTFIIPVLLLDLNLAVIVSIIYGLVIISLLSYYIAKTRAVDPTKLIIQHLTVTIIVIFLTNFVGAWINRTFI